MIMAPLSVAEDTFFNVQSSLSSFFSDKQEDQGGTAHSQAQEEDRDRQGGRDGT